MSYATTCPECGSTVCPTIADMTARCKGAKTCINVGCLNPRFDNSKQCQKHYPHTAAYATPMVAAKVAATTAAEAIAADDATRETASTRVLEVDPIERLTKERDEAREGGQRAYEEACIYIKGSEEARSLRIALEAVWLTHPMNPAKNPGVNPWEAVHWPRNADGTRTGEKITVGDIGGVMARTVALPNPTRDAAEAKLTAALAKNVELACANQALKAGVRCLREQAVEARAVFDRYARQHGAAAAEQRECGSAEGAEVSTRKAAGNRLQADKLDACLAETAWHGRGCPAETADLAPAQEVPTHIGSIPLPPPMRGPVPGGWGPCEHGRDPAWRCDHSACSEALTRPVDEALGDDKSPTVDQE